MFSPNSLSIKLGSLQVAQIRFFKWNNQTFFTSFYRELLKAHYLDEKEKRNMPRTQQDSNPQPLDREAQLCFKVEAQREMSAIILEETVSFCLIETIFEMWKTQPTFILNLLRHQQQEEKTSNKWLKGKPSISAAFINKASSIKKDLLADRDD